MSFFKKITDGVKGGVEDTKFKADQYMRIQRVQGEVSALHKEMASVRGKIANTVIELYNQSTLSHKELVDLCLIIDQFYAQISQKEAQIAAIRAEEPPKLPPSVAVYNTRTKICPQCQAPIALEATFCTNCGNVLTQQPIESSKDINDVSETAIKCANCGFVLSTETEFCSNCGQAVVR